LISRSDCLPRGVALGGDRPPLRGLLARRLDIENELLRLRDEAGI